MPAERHLTYCQFLVHTDIRVMQDNGEYRLHLGFCYGKRGLTEILGRLQRTEPTVEVQVALVKFLPSFGIFQQVLDVRAESLCQVRLHRSEVVKVAILGKRLPHLVKDACVEFCIRKREAEGRFRLLVAILISGVVKTAIPT